MPRTKRGEKLDKNVDYRELSDFPRYYIGNDGVIWNLNGWKGGLRKLPIKVNQSIDSNGYYIVNVSCISKIKHRHLWGWLND
jgi:hypothetical protein